MTLYEQALKAKAEGFKAFERGAAVHENPHEPARFGSDPHKAWRVGWYEARATRAAAKVAV